MTVKNSGRHARRAGRAAGREICVCLNRDRHASAGAEPGAAANACEAANTPDAASGMVSRHYYTLLRLFFNPGTRVFRQMTIKRRARDDLRVRPARPGAYCAGCRGIARSATGRRRLFRAFDNKRNHVNGAAILGENAQLTNLLFPNGPVYIKIMFNKQYGSVRLLPPGAFLQERPVGAHGDITI